jgi:hypothetical protein
MQQGLRLLAGDPDSVTGPHPTESPIWLFISFASCKYLEPSHGGVGIVGACLHLAQWAVWFKLLPQKALEWLSDVDMSQQ